MAHPLADLFGTPYVGLIIVVIAVAVGVTIRLYLMRNRGIMRAKCPKCSNVFDVSRSFSLVHIGTLRQIKCPACGKTSFMNIHVKDPITWPSETKKETPATSGSSEEELERKRIEESKYERS